MLLAEFIPIQLKGFGLYLKEVFWGYIIFYFKKAFTEIC